MFSFITLWGVKRCLKTILSHIALPCFNMDSYRAVSYAHILHNKKAKCLYIYATSGIVKHKYGGTRFEQTFLELLTCYNPSRSTPSSERDAWVPPFPRKFKGNSWISGFTMDVCTHDGLPDLAVGPLSLKFLFVVCE